MPLPLIRTENKKWYPGEKRYTGSQFSERGALHYHVRCLPGITTEELQRIAPDETRSRVPSRLAELEKEGYLRSEYEVDLFK